MPQPLPSEHERDSSRIASHMEANGAAPPREEPPTPASTSNENASSAAATKASRPRASEFHLAIFDDCLRSVPLVDGTLLVGRGKSNHLQLHDGLLSRKHCSLTTSKGNLTLVDLNSSNGTYVNGERIGTRELRIDDIVELGKTVLVVFDGTAWRRGDGLMNLRNPVKAQELVQRLSEAGRGVPRADQVATGPKKNGVRSRKGLDDLEKACLRWLERGETRVLPDMIANYLSHKLVSLLCRNSAPIRSAVTAVMEEMLRPELYQQVGTWDELQETIRERVATELRDLREEDLAEGLDLASELDRSRDLLELDEDEPGDPTPS